MKIQLFSTSVEEIFLILYLHILGLKISFFVAYGNTFLYLYIGKKKWWRFSTAGFISWKDATGPRRV